VKWIAFFVALAIHGLALLINFPEIARAVQVPRQQSYIVVKKYVPPPPPLVERTSSVRQQRLTRRVPIPTRPGSAGADPRARAEILPPPLPADVEVLIGVPSLPRPSRAARRWSPAWPA